MDGYAPIVVIGVGLVVMYVVQSRVTATVDYTCGRCGQRFDLTPLAATLAPHRMGSKWVRCPECGAWSWAAPHPKD